MTGQLPRRSPAGPAPRVLTGSVYDRGAVLSDGAVAIEDGRIRYAGSLAGLPPSWATTPRHSGWAILPGLVDIHCHGGDGGEFGPDRTAALRGVRHHRACGTTTMLASMVSAEPDHLRAGVATLARLVVDGEVDGIHLEGPFLSDARRGAQNPAALTDPDLRLVEDLVATAAAAGAPGAIRQMTFAPERDAASALPKALGRWGIRAAIGHTDADAAVCARALADALDHGPQGSRPVVTHVFNGMPPMHHRAPGPVAAALTAAARGAAVLEVIADGTHLAPETVRMLFELVGPERLSLVSDAMSATGLPPGRYTLGGLDVDVADGAARLAGGGSIAGSTSTLLDCVRWAVTVAGIPLADAITAATLTPARAMGLDAGTLVVGGRADLLVLDDRLDLQLVLRGGQPV